jgi:serine O-acetyltransferase
MKIIKWFYDTGFRACQYYKLAEFFKKRNFIKVAKLVLVICKSSTGVEFSISCKVGKNFKIAHGQNIVIGGNSTIGDNVTVYNSVTLGVSGRLYMDINGKLMQFEDYPTIGNNCIIYTGAKILGNTVIGDNSIIGANSVVINSFSDNSIIAGIPATLKSINKFDLSSF